MADEITPDPRRELLESNLARARDKLTTAELRVEQLQQQVAGLEADLAALDEPAPEE
jgi:hypothetical protein